MPYKILIVDDEPDLLESVSFLLEDAGYEVACATNGHEAIGATHTFQPDLVLLDVMMPKENGYRVSRKLHEAQSFGLLPDHMKVVLVTARKLDHDPEREKMFENYARPHGVVYKPFDPEQLLSTIRGLVEPDTRPVPLPIDEVAEPG
ncbi:MAG: response regulator transcription factor [Leptospirillia bacterium]